MDSSVRALRPFRDLARGLAKNGIASIRYNKIAFQDPSKLQTDYDFTPSDEYTNDALAALQLLLDDSRIDSSNIFVLGHSQGGQFAPVISNIDERIKGMIVMAGVMVHILDLLLEQIKTNQGLDAYNTYLPHVLATKEIKTPDSSKRNSAYFGAYYNYWLEYNSLDFKKEVLRASDKVAILVMQGGKDLQVYPEFYLQYRQLLEMKSSVKFKEYANLNHLFVDAGNESLATAYQKPGNIDEQVVADITSFIFSN